jgi:hypothetical protein
MIRIIILLFLFSNLALADQFEDIPAKLEMNAGQTVRRNLTDTAFEAVAFPTPLPTSTPQVIPTPLPTATPQSFPTPVPTPTGIPLPLSLVNGGSELSNALTTVSTNGNINNLAVTSSVLKFIGSSSQTLTGLVSAAKAQKVTLLNINGSGAFTLSHENGSSSANNRLNLPNSANYSLPFNTGVELVYDTHSSRWRVTSEYFTVASPLYKSSSQLGIYQATTGQSGFISSSDYATYLDNWKQTGQDIYNTNVNNVWITLYPCSALTTYATCTAKTQCSAGASGACSDFNGDQSSCEAQFQCSWSEADCNGSYFVSGDCSGNYNADDGTSSKLQVKATVQCSGSSNACSTYNADSGQCTIQGCSFVSNTCGSFGDESTCNNNSPCSWTNNPQDCSAYNNDSYTCSNTSGCTFNECSSYGDESSCTSANAACGWSVTPCSTYNGDQYNCDNNTSYQCSYESASCSAFNGTDQNTCEANSGCSWSEADCNGSYYTGNCTGAGFDGTCSGTWCSGSYDSYSCSGDNGGCFGNPYSCVSRSDSSSCTAVLPCSWTTTPAGRFQGDLIATSEGFLKFEKTNLGAPPNADCNADDERGRLVIDISNNRLYICNGASRGWDYIGLTN